MVYHSKITIQSCNQTKTVMVGENQCQEVTNINKDEKTLSDVMKSLWKITKSIGSIESRLNKLENITKKVPEIEKKTR